MLLRPPGPKDLSRMYCELSRFGAACTGKSYPWPYRLKNLEETLVLAAEMSRCDPRLLSILTEFFLSHWQEISPQRLRSYYGEMQSPQAIAVVLEFVKSATKEAELLYLISYLQQGISPVPVQWYFKNLYSPGGKLGQRAAEEALVQYRRWGFLAREAPAVDIYHKKTVGRMHRDGRLRFLEKLLKDRREITLREYQQKLGMPISRQQALADLRQVAYLSTGKKGRGARWHVMN